MQEELCDLKVHINGQHTFLLSQMILSTYCGRLRKTIRQEKRRGGQVKGASSSSSLNITYFPGGADGFELAARFCYNDGRVPMSPSNICLLHCSATFLEMTEEFSACNLLSQAETFLDGLFYWTWNDILTSLKSCETFLHCADSSGILQRLVSSLLAKISANSEIPLSMTTPLVSYSSSSSSPDTSGFRFSSTTKTLDNIKPCLSREWWFDDLTILHPKIIEKIITTLGAYGSDNKNLILTRFLLHYLKTAAQRPVINGVQCRSEYGGLADTAVHGVVLMGRTAFSCRGLFWVLRVVSGLGLSKECRQKLERLMGMILDQATLDDLLVSGHGDGAVYDVNLVLRLVKVFVSSVEGEVSLQRMKKVGRLLDKYLGEISPDQNLKVPKFVGLAESLPDSARDCFDGVYRALDIYLESHPTLPLEDRSRLCRCLNYEKLTLDACRDLAKNPRIPPRAAVQALLVSPPSKQHSTMNELIGLPWPAEARRTAVYYKGEDLERGMTSPSSQQPKSPSEFSVEKEELRMNLQKMQWRVVELEKVCLEMKGQMSKMARSKVNGSSPSHPHHHSGRGLPRLC